MKIRGFSLRAIFIILMVIMGPGHVTAHASAFLPSGTFPSHTSPLRVGLIDRFSNRPTISINNTSIVYRGHGDTMFFHSPTGFVVRPYGNMVALYDGSQRVMVSNFMLIYDDFGIITIDGVSFRGGIEFALLGSGVTAVNWVSIEEYLFSVVPSEMPATWHPEALRAQAVAARTYALFNRDRSVHVGFDLCNTVCCQVYRGIEWEHESSTNAVLATTGLALYHSGDLIDAVYFASSGGFTENSENVWLEMRPYLRAVPDIYEHEPVIWTRTFPMTEITSLLARNNRSIGSAVSVAIGAFLPSGRVETLVIQGTAGQVVLEREEIRTFFAHSAEGSLPSRRFTLGSAALPVPGASVYGSAALPVPGVSAYGSAADVVVYDGYQMINLSLVGAYVITAFGIHQYDHISHDTPGVPQTGITGVPQAGTPIVPQTGITGVPHAVVHEVPPPQVGGTVVLTGTGFGHGVGMSQRGAEGMARRGYTFREILAHFYRGVTIE